MSRSSPKQLAQVFLGHALQDCSTGGAGDFLAEEAAELGRESVPICVRIAAFKGFTRGMPRAVIVSVCGSGDASETVIVGVGV